MSYTRLARLLWSLLMGWWCLVSKENIFLFCGTHTFYHFWLLYDFVLYFILPKSSSSSSIATTIELPLPFLKDGIKYGYRTADAFVRGAALDELVQGDFSVTVAVHFLRGRNEGSRKMFEHFSDKALNRIV